MVIITYNVTICEKYCISNFKSIVCFHGNSLYSLFPIMDALHELMLLKSEQE